MKNSYDRTPPITALLGEILTLKQAAEYLKCHTSTMYRLVKHGGVPHFRLGGDIRFKKSTIDNWIKKKTYPNLLIGVRTFSKSNPLAIARKWVRATASTSRISIATNAA